MTPVLYVEDEEDDVFLLQRAWNRAGLPHPLIILPDGAQAVDYLLGRGAFADRVHHPLPCLVLLDLNLPVKGGLEVLREVRRQFPPHQLPVVIVSSSDVQRDREAALDRGANGYRVKPRDFHGIQDLVADLGRQWLPRTFSARAAG